MKAIEINCAMEYKALMMECLYTKALKNGL